MANKVDQWLLENKTACCAYATNKDRGYLNSFIDYDQSIHWSINAFKLYEPHDENLTRYVHGHTDYLAHN